MSKSNREVDKFVDVYTKLQGIKDVHRKAIKSLFDELNKQYTYLLRYGKEENVPIIRRVLNIIDNMSEHITQPEVKLAQRAKQMRGNSSLLYKFYDKDKKDIDELEVLDNLILQGKVSRKGKKSNARPKAE